MTIHRAIPFVLTVAAYCGLGITVARAVTVEYAGSWSPNLEIPDNDDNGVVSTQAVSTNFRTLGSITVHLTTTDGWNGDLYMYLQHSSGISILLNRPGRTTLLPDGSDNAGFDITLSDAAANDINTDPTGSGQITGTWQPDGRFVDPAFADSSYSRTAMLSNFIGMDPNGTWTLFMADVSAGEQATLTNWGMTIRAPNSLDLSGGVSIFGDDNNAYNGPINVDSTATLEVTSTGRLTAMTEINLNGGTLLLSGSGIQRVNNGVGEAPLHLNNGGKLALSGVAISENFGALQVTNGGVIDFGSGAGQLEFADSSALTWSGMLQFWNWNGSTDHVTFGSTALSLTPEQIASVEFFSDNGGTSLGGGVLQPDGSMVPVPEAGAVFASGILLASVLVRRRKGGH